MIKYLKERASRSSRGVPLAAYVTHCYRKVQNAGPVAFIPSHVSTSNSTSSSTNICIIVRSSVWRYTSSISDVNKGQQLTFVDNIEEKASTYLVSIVIRCTAMELPVNPPLLAEKTSRKFDFRWRNLRLTSSVLANSNNSRLALVNRTAMAAFWFVSVSFIYTLHVRIIPNVFHHPTDRLLYTAVSWFIFFQISINWCLAARLRSSVVRAAIAPVDSRFLDGWHRCVTCQMDAPPRAHHCKVCGVCVLKHGGHCFFTGACVGFANQRYFAALTLYVTLGSALFAFLFFAYLFTCIIPLPSPNRMTPDCTPWDGELFVLVQFYFSFLTLLAGVYNFLSQSLLIARGQTCYEFKKSIHRYSGTIAQNCRSVFGVAWWLILVCPFLARCQTGDGVIWRLQKAVKYRD